MDAVAVNVVGNVPGAAETLPSEPWSKRVIWAPPWRASTISPRFAPPRRKPSPMTCSFLRVQECQHDRCSVGVGVGRLACRIPSPGSSHERDLQ
jgi:hypothetical protein